MLTKYSLKDIKRRKFSVMLIAMLGLMNQMMQHWKFQKFPKAAKLLIGVTEEEIIFTVEEITVFGLTWKEHEEMVKFFKK